MVLPATVCTPLSYTSELKFEKLEALILYVEPGLRLVGPITTPPTNRLAPRSAITTAAAVDVSDVLATRPMSRSFTLDNGKDD
jgi:hypothetical protein